MHEKQEFSMATIAATLLALVLAVQIGWMAYGMGKGIAAQPYPDGRGPQAGATMEAVSEGAIEPANGQSLYAGNCAGCHGAAGEGTVGPSLATAAGWDLAGFNEATLHGVTPDGRELAPVMPRFADTGLNGDTATDEQLTALHEYVKTLY